MQDWLTLPAVTRRQVLKAALVFTTGVVMWRGYPKLNAATDKAIPALSELSWETLKNLTYPTAWINRKVVTLTNGEFRRPATANGAPALYAYLCEQRVFGDLNGDGQADAAVLLAYELEGRGIYIDLVAVLNQAGAAYSITPSSLGDRLILKSLAIEQGEVVLVAGERTPGDGDSAPDQVSRYRLHGNRLTLIEKMPVPALLPSRTIAEEERLPAIIALALSTPQTAKKLLPGQSIHAYRSSIGQNHRLYAELTAPSRNVVLSIYGDDDQVVLTSVSDESSRFEGITPSAQPYVIQVVNLGNQPSSYSLTLQIDAA